MGTGNRVKLLISSGEISNWWGIEFGTDACFHVLSTEPQVMKLGTGCHVPQDLPLEV
jgi:hypothetical protein